MKKLLVAFITAVLFISLSSGGVQPVRADDPPGFTPNNLIADAAFTSDSMSANDINAFLASKGSWLADYTIPEYMNVPYFCKEGGNNQIRVASVRQYYPGFQIYGLRAADLIYTRARANGINPQVLLVLIQRESSGVTSNPPLSDMTRAWPLFYAFNEQMASYQYNCTDAEAIAQNYGGTGQQLAYTPYGLMHLYSTPSQCPNTQVIDGVTMNMASRGTAALYCYTPHVYDGNHNFWLFYTIWFGSAPPPPYAPPLVISNGKVYVADQNQLWHVTSQEVFDVMGFNWNNVVPLSGSPYAAYPISGGITRLVRNSVGRVFYLEGAKKRPIMSARIFLSKGFHWEDVSPVNDAILSSIPTGIPLFELVRIAGTSSIYFQSYGEDHHVESADIFSGAWNLDWTEVADVPAYVVYQFPLTRSLSRYALSDQGRIYYLDGGFKYDIPSADVFNQYGFPWDLVVRTGNNILDQKPSGGALTSLVGSPDGKVYYIEAGKKRYATFAKFTARHFSFGDVRWLTQSAVDAIPTGANL
jgi:hypothetical protein